MEEGGPRGTERKEPGLDGDGAPTTPTGLDEDAADPEGDGEEGNTPG